MRIALILATVVAFQVGATEPPKPKAKALTLVTQADLDEALESYEGDAIADTADIRPARRDLAEIPRHDSKDPKGDPH